ncbi:MAG: ROK family protein [Henriciella sp.]
MMLDRSSNNYYGGIEAGGTKFVCALGDARGQILQQITIPTSSPQETLSSVFGFFRSQPQKVSAIGVGAFGPIDLNTESMSYGRILPTPKPGWTNTDIVGEISSALQTPVSLDTDVNCALLAEAETGAGRGFANLAYVTIGTGIGAGIMTNRQVLYGASHPEIGHMYAPSLPFDQDFEGVCPYHGKNCLEGLVSGPAIYKRWQLTSSELPEGHEAWQIIAHYISIVCMNVQLCVAPDKIILGGGVMRQQKLFPLVRDSFRANLNGYGRSGVNLNALEEFIVPPGLNGDAGVIGALQIARSEQNNAKILV